MVLMQLTVRRLVVIVRQYNGIGIDKKLAGYHLATGKPLKQRYYNGRIVYQYKSLRVGLTKLRRQPPCRQVLNMEEPFLPFRKLNTLLPLTTISPLCSTSSSIPVKRPSAKPWK